MGLLKYSFILAVRATPHLVVSKFFYETRWNIYGTLAIVLAAMAIFTAPVFIVLVPLISAYLTTAMSLTSLHSMLGYLGSVRPHKTEYLLQETLKMGMVRGLAATLVSAVVLALLMMLYGTAHFAQALSDPLAFLLADTALLNEGRIPALVAGSLLFAPFSIVLNALFAVPMAGAAYTIGLSDRVFNGLWGIGYNFWEILASRILHFLIMASFVLVAIELFIPEVSIRALLHLVQSFIAGTPPDLLAYPVSEPKFETFGAQIALIVFIVFGNYLSQPLWLAMCALSFRLALEDEIEREKAEDKGQGARIAEAEAERIKTTNLRKQRMPARWQS